MPDGSHFFPDEANALIIPLEPTLADLLVALKNDSSLSKSKREAWGCSVRRVAMYLERDPAQLIARLEALRFGISRLHHAQLGIARKTLQNHIANLRAAVRHFTGVRQLSGRGVSMSSAWKVLYDQLEIKRLRLGLSGFLRYCSAKDINPSGVCDATVNDFIAYARDTQFTVKPKDLHKQAARCWNRARESVADWPQITLTVPDNRPVPKSLPWDAYPVSFVEDVERHLKLMSGDNLLDEDAPDRPCKANTINTRRDYLKLAASAAVKQGVEVGNLRSLADLVTPKVVKIILDDYIGRADGKVKTFTIELSERLRGLARRYVKASEADIAVLDRYCRKLGQHRHTGLTQKNMATVRQLKDPETRQQFLLLPDQLFEEALAEREALIQAAVKAELALVIHILQFDPMRLANLAALNLDMNVIRTGGKNPAWHIVIPGEDVKNEQPLEFPLPQPLNEMLGAYLGLFRPRLCREESSWLFPGEASGHKTKGTLSSQITKLTAKRIGIRITPHQFRHLAAAIILERDPANYEFVRRILGHKNIETTIKFYVGLETLDAVRQFAALILEEDA